MSEYLDALKKLHTVLIDSRIGYDEALSEAEGKGLAPLFREMIDIRDRHHAELDAHLREAGATPDESGSFLSVVHRTIFKIRSLVSGLDGSVLPGLIDGEERIAGYYEDVLRDAPPPGVASTLNGQVITIRQQISKMQALAERSGSAG
jgi:uncharacterized protein (TIGR02284 family)